ncbi:C4-dicarboxylate ABC transporter substrate-binding protein [Psychromonas sp. psych-6C06]|uniref:TAXI family TRAP transporter solute-binding subunit n=1 Tax=Psychromonas sp. psych-6C06 TaxID=2058089 RepID=UPI000C331F09|nr:TAXI family TRAP transporter solute-binding subunit [Psychromonas sp. psych-6C06]PKF60481.1 C4-dicarboxylate ABC transporter substrate-binding protein [Psychromonas sp. psych-6C06]
MRLAHQALATIPFFMFLLLSFSVHSKVQYLTIGTGGVTGVYYPTGGAICHLANQITDGNYHCEIKSTPGSIYNIEGIRSGELTIGVLQSDWQFHAYEGSGRYKEVGKFSTLRSLFSVHAEPFTVLSRSDSDISSFEDLKGKRVNIGAPRSGQRATMEMLLNLYGWEIDDFETALELTPSEQAKALCDDRVDAIIYVVGHPNSSIKEASGACQTKLVNVAGDKIDRITEETSYYQKAVIPGGMYRGSPNATDTFGVGAVITTTSELSEEVAYQLVKSIFENHAEFIQLHPAFKLLKKHKMVSNSITAPLHKGAVRYYKEVGLIK